MGYKHVGKKVENSELRIGNDFYLEKSKATSDGKISLPQITQEGKLVSSSAAISVVALADSDKTMTAGDLEAGIWVMTPSTPRTLTLPSAEDVGDALNFTEHYQFADIVIINTGARYQIVLAAGAGSAITGSANIVLAESGLFRIISDVNGYGTTIVRIA